MTQKELVADIAEETDESQSTVKEIVDATFEAIADVLEENGEISINGFGKFSLGHREQREGRNPATGESMTIPAQYTPKFKAAKGLKELVNS